MKTAALLLAVLLGLGGCSLMPSRLEMGTPRDEVVRRLGQPTSCLLYTSDAADE